MVTHRDRQRAQSHRIAQQTALAAQPASGGLAAAAVQAASRFLASDGGDEQFAPKVLNSPASFSVPTGLPAQGLRELRRLESACADRALILRGLNDALHGTFQPGAHPVSVGLEQAVLTARAAFNEVAGTQHRRGIASPDSVTYQQREQTLAAAVAARDEAVQRLTVTSQRQSADLVILDSLKKHLAGKTSVVAFEGKVLKGETLDSIRDGTAELQRQRGLVESAPLSSSVIRAKISSQVAALAARGAPSIDAAGNITFPLTQNDLVVQVVGPSSADGVTRAQGFGVTKSTDSAALFAWLFPGDLEEALLTKVPAVDDSRALTPFEKSKKLSEIDAAIVSNDRGEAALVAASNGAIAYRVGISAAAVLGLQ